MRMYFLPLLLLALSSLVSSQWSYIPSRLFASYQFFCINTNNANATLTASNHSNPYVLPLRDIHNNVMSDDVIYGGHTSVNSSQNAFEISIVGNTTTQYAFSLNIQGDAAYAKMQFFLILIGNEATNYLQAIFFTQICNLNSTNATDTVTSPNQTVTTTVTGTFQVSIFLTFWNLNITGGGTTFQVGANLLTASTAASGPIVFEYYTSNGNTLSNIGLLIFVVTDNPMPTNVSKAGFGNQVYSSALNNLVSGSPVGAYDYGFDPKCMFGVKSLVSSNTAYLQYDTSNILPNVTSNFSGAFTLRHFGMVLQYNCSIIDVNCLQCTSHSKCSSCVNTHYVQNYPNVTAKCLPCSNAITGCLNCTNTSMCQACVTPTYLMDAGDLCSLCSVYVANCINCTDNVTCTACVAYYGLVNSTTCSLCSGLMAGCQYCNSPTVCTGCYNGYYLSSSTCFLCNNGVANCAVCSSATTCQLCYSDSYLSSTNTSCICNTGLIQVTGLCTVIGCSSAYRFNSTTYCLACNTLDNFYYYNHTCSCKIGYQLNGFSCKIVCGDGILVTQGCDDGNVINGDGCSQTCTIQNNYNCVNGSLTQPSVCFYISNIEVQLLQINKITSANQCEIVLSLSPVIRNFNNMDFNTYLQLAIPNKDITYSSQYNSDNGQLTVLVSYSSNLQGLSATLSLSYDPTLVQLSTKTLTFEMKGYNEPINVSSYSGLQTIIKYAGYALAGLYILVLVLSIAFHKMVGLQTMQILQIVYFVRYLLDNTGPMAVYNMQTIGYINGYNVFMDYPNIVQLDGVLVRMGIAKNFVFNVYIQVVLILLAWLVSLFFGKKVANLKIAGAQHTSLGMQQLKRATTLQYKCILMAFIITTYSFFLFAFGLLSSLQVEDQINYQLPQILVIFTIVVFIYVGLYMTAQMYINWKGKWDQDEGLWFKYVALFLGWQILVVVAIIGLHGVSLALQIIAGLQGAYVVMLILFKPYYSKSQNVILILCNFISLGFTVFLVLTRHIALSDSITSYIVLAFQGLLSVAGVLALVRLYLHSKHNQKAFKLMHDEEDKLKGKDTFTKMEFKKQQEMIIINQKNKPTYTQKKQLREQLEKDELAMIKARLKGEFKQRLQEKEENPFLE